MIGDGLAYHTCLRNQREPPPGMGWERWAWVNMDTSWACRGEGSWELRRDSVSMGWGKVGYAH